MRRNFKLEYSLFLVVLLVTSACSHQSPSTPIAITKSGEEPVDQPSRQVVRTLALENLPLTITVPPSPSPLLKYTPIKETKPPITNTPTLRKTPSTSNPNPTVKSCSDKAKFIKHLNISDYTNIKANFAFVKIWQIKNTGTCTWSEDYSLVFIDGDSMNGPQSISIPHIAALNKPTALKTLNLPPTPLGTSRFLKPRSRVISCRVHSPASVVVTI